MPSRTDNGLWSGLCPVERDEVLADLLVQAAQRTGTQPVQLLQTLTCPRPAPALQVRPVATRRSGSSAPVTHDLTPGLAAQLADLHQQVLRAVADRRNQARQRALARRRQVARRALILGARVFGAPLAVLLYWLASTTHRDWRTASADAASSLTTLATAQVPLADARQLEAELQAEIARLEPFARESKDAAASVESTAGSELPGGSASIVQLQTLVAQQTAERARLQERHTELEQQFFQAAPARLGLQQA